MSQNFNKVGYGLSQALPDIFPSPIVSTRNPTVNDKEQIGSTWINKATNGSFTLTSVVNNQAHWVTSSGGAGIATITGNSGGAVGPTAGNVNIVGAGPITVAGVAGTSTLTVQSLGTLAEAFDTDDGNTSIPVGGVLNVNGVDTTGTATSNIFTSSNPNFSNNLGIMLNPSLVFPATSADQSEGVISFGGSPFIQSYGTENTFIGEDAGNFTLTVVSAFNNVAVGAAALSSIATSDGNIAIGKSCLTSFVSGIGGNVAIGTTTLQQLVSGADNTVIGDSGAISLAGGASDNTLIGSEVATSLTSGNGNIIIGFDGGANYTGAESNNILLSNDGVLGESNVIRIGTQGNGLGQQDTCFIAGIFGTTVDAGSGTAVFVDNTGLLGTIVSSIRFKENVIEMGNESSPVLDLRPVTFNLINDNSKALRYGLIAEEVMEIMPQLVTFDSDNLPYTVAYNDLPVLLLNELKKAIKRIEELERKIK